METESDDIEVDADDFWAEYQPEAPLPLDPVFKSEDEYNRTKSMRNTLPSKFLFKKLTWQRNEELQESMQSSIDLVRYYNQLEREDLIQKVKNSTKKDLKAVVEQINQEFEEEIHSIRLEHNRMKDEISKKNREKALLTKFMADQEIQISQNRLIYLLKNFEPEANKEALLEKKNLKQDLKVTKVQIVALKDAIVEYQNETAIAARKINDLDEQIAMIKMKHRQEIRELQDFLEQKLEKATKERDIVKQAFDVYKSTGWDELERKEDCLIRQNEIIIKLQKELKQAKSILSQPKLKLRVHNRLKDYIEEYEQDFDEQPENPPKNPKESLKKYPKTEVHKKFLKSLDLDAIHQSSTCSDTNTMNSKFNTRRSSVTYGRSTRLSPF
jgi:hypothetical protein